MKLVTKEKPLIAKAQPPRYFVELWGTELFNVTALPSPLEEFSGDFQVSKVCIGFADIRPSQLKELVELLVADRTGIWLDVFSRTFRPTRPATKVEDELFG